MLKELDIVLEKVVANRLKKKPSLDDLGFGAHFTDYMFLMQWNKEYGWHEGKICSHQKLTLDPASMVFHYGQAVFEGLKAYRGKNDQLFLFRPQDNFARMNISAMRMCMPRIPVEKMVNIVKSLVYLEQAWVPRSEGASLYIRPTMIAVESDLGVRPSEAYYFYIILAPVGSYYAEGYKPMKIYVSDDYVRAVRGGVGNVKTVGNYAASLYAYEIAKKLGCTQVLWLDACERKYVEEVGTSNIFFKIDDRLITPPLEGSILAGLTRDSVLKLVTSWGLDVIERKISIDEVLKANSDGQLQEAFGTGTAAVISPIGEFVYRGNNHVINKGQTGELSAKLFKELEALQRGYRGDPFQWITRVV